MKNKLVEIIPARYKSTRFPGKPLVKLLGKPMIIQVAELSSKALGKENIFVTTEDDRIRKVVEEAGFNAIMTSDEHPTGTDQLAEVANKVMADYYINIQGDEPTVNPKVITNENNDLICMSRLAIPGFINIEKEKTGLHGNETSKMVS